MTTIPLSCRRRSLISRRHDGRAVADLGAHAVHDLAGDLLRLPEAQVNLAVVNNDAGEFTERRIRVLEVALVGVNRESAQPREQGRRQKAASGGVSRAYARARCSKAIRARPEKRGGVG